MNKLTSILVSGAITILIAWFVFGKVSVYQKAADVRPSDTVNTPGSSISEEQRSQIDIYEAGVAVCETSFTLSPQTTQVTCNQACNTTNLLCTGGTTCIEGRCRNNACNTEVDCVCPTPIVQCNQACTITADGKDNCPTGLSCRAVNGQYKCVNSSCPTRSDCVCPTASPTPTPTASPTPTPTGKPVCYQSCSSDNDCPDYLLCRKTDGANRCVNPNCSGDKDCTCDTTTPKEPELPKAGGIPPTVIFIIGGIVIVLLGLIF